MKKKVLVVSEKGMFAALWINDVSGTNMDIVASLHVAALAALEEGVPQIIIVDDYNENGSLVKGFQTYHEIKERLRPWQVLVRMGNEDYTYPDYIRLPHLVVPMIDGIERFEKTIRSLLAE